jgi:ATP-dependent RNA helicase SUPV3L1/SUV3
MTKAIDMNITNKAVKAEGRVTAVLGPTNTGKTHFAIEQMLSYKSGCIGFPLRLLARENYDRVAKEKGKGLVALVTGEEKIVPPDAKYFLCTVESMPVEQSFEFLAVDEIQLCADPDRGHIFTDRLLRARGTEATMFMGSETIKPILSALVPGIEIVTRPRLSVLEYTGFKKLTRLNKRTAVVAFSIDDVYAIADLVRRQRGGTAVVLGALSPRTRNAQVEMYQSGEVDFMVATDAIGMGLNMDIHHVALAATRKYDGERARNLSNAELAQIAGRAGRYKKDGTFGVTGNVRGLDDETVDAIEKHQFDSLQHVYWRNAELDYNSPLSLLRSLERSSGTALLQKGRPSDDYITLNEMLGRDEVMALASGNAAVRLLWDVCQIPDFRKTMNENHQDIVAEIYTHLRERDVLPEDWMEEHIARLDSTEGEVDTLMTRISHIRTWTYITHRADWVADPAHWRGRTLKIEDRLSDALHEALTKRFVDRRSAVLLGAMEEGSPLLAGIKKDGEVVVEGQRVGILAGFRFYPDETSGREEFKAIMTAARQALKPEIGIRLSMILKAEDKQFKLDDQGQILWQQDITNPLPGAPVGLIRKGDSLLKPRAEAIDSNLLDGQDKNAVAEKLQDWLDRHIHFTLEPLFRLTGGEDLTGQARGIAFQLQEALGILPREALEDLIASLDEEGRKALRARKVRMGPLLVFLPELNKPVAVRLRAILLTLWQGKDLPAEKPKDGIVSFSVEGKGVDADYYRSIGYPVYGPRAIRVDMLDRVVCAVYDSAKDGKFQAQHKMAEWLGSNILDLYAVLEAMGHRKIHDPAEEKAKEESVSPALEAMEAIAPVQQEPVEETPAVSEEGDTTALVSGGPTLTAMPEKAVPDAAGETVKAEEPKTVRPELATFRLKRGKANQAEKPREPRKFEKKDGGKAPYKASKPFDKNKDKNKGDGEKPFRKKEKRPERKDRERDREDRVYSSAPQKLEDSPFAILQQLKLGNEKKS